jgi:hypothetical protein
MIYLVNFIKLLGTPLILCWMHKPSQEKRLFLEEKHERRKGQLEGKATCVREERQGMHARNT